MDRVEKAILKRFKTLLSQRVKLDKIILFGSRARGDAARSSDMDLIVILDDLVDDETRDYVSDCAWEAGFEYGIVVVPFVFNKNEWDNGPERYSLFVKAVEMEGVPF